MGGGGWQGGCRIQTYLLKVSDPGMDSVLGLGRNYITELNFYPSMYECLYLFIGLILDFEFSYMTYSGQ